MITSTAVELEPASISIMTQVGLGITILGIIMVIIATILVNNPNFDMTSLMFVALILLVSSVLIIIGGYMRENIVFDSNEGLIESHYNVIITSKDNGKIAPEKDENKIEKYEVRFNDGSLDGKFDELKGEVRVKGNEAVLFYAPDSLDDEMVPYETE